MTPHYFDLDGKKLHYLEGGNGKTIVFIHGLGLQASTYHKTLTALSQSYHVIAPDIFGFGKSDMPYREWSFTHYGTFLDTFLTKKHIHDITLIGHSLGGRVALAMGSRSKKVRKVVLVDPSPVAVYFKKEKNHTIRLVKNTLYEFLMRKNFRYLPVLRDVMQNLLSNPLKTMLLRKILINAVLYDDFDEGSLQAPALILWGQEDTVIPLSYSEELVKLLPHATLQIVPGDHIWCITHPEYFRDTIAAFIEQ